MGFMLSQRPGLFQHRSSSGTESFSGIRHRPRTSPSPGAQPRQALQKPDERLFAGLGSDFCGTKWRRDKKSIVFHIHEQRRYIVMAETGTCVRGNKL